MKYKLHKLNYTAIDFHIIRMLVGFIAISLAFITQLFSGDVVLQSISHSYHIGGASRNIFVGFLFAISTFLFAYNGCSYEEMILSKVAAFSALGIAMFPCKCGCYEELVPYLHAISAFVMFTILAAFCGFFYKHASDKGEHMQAKIRKYIYAICGFIILISIFVAFKLSGSRVVYFAETLALLSFGVAWLIASRVLPYITTKDERISLIPKQKSL